MALEWVSNVVVVRPGDEVSVRVMVTWFLDDDGELKPSTSGRAWVSGRDLDEAARLAAGEVAK